MTLANYFFYILIGLCCISLLMFIIFILKNSDDNIDYDKIIAELNKQKENDLETLDNGNKEIDKIEKKILICKKELGIKLFKNKKNEWKS